jgi:hypothetical protein
MNEKRQTYTVCGVFNGRDISVPGHETYWKAREYASLKGWTEIEVIKG